MITLNGTPDIIAIVVLSWATFCLSWMVAKLHGPWHVFEKLRERFPLGGLLKCWKCLSIWWAFVLLWIWTYVLGVKLPLAQWLVFLPAIAGCAWLLAHYAQAAFSED